MSYIDSKIVGVQIFFFESSPQKLMFKNYFVVWILVPKGVETLQKRSEPLWPPHGHTITIIKKLVLRSCLPINFSEEVF